MKGLVSVVFLWISSTAFSQNINLQKIDASGITKVELEVDAVSKVSLKTHKENYILLHSVTEGEYRDDFFLLHQVIDGVFYISSNYDLKLEDGFDKLSAMKVFSVEIEIFIPEDLSVFISSSTASLEVLGQYYELNVALKSGSVLLNNYEGNAHVHTYNGNIDISTVDAKVNATSRNGTIHVVDFYVKRNFIEITSINGNIKVTSSEH
jgi:DUF4097 and DUF4098 domain-containing protein YvlB